MTVVSVIFYPFNSRHDTKLSLRAMELNVYNCVLYIYQLGETTFKTTILRSITVKKNTNISVSWVMQVASDIYITLRYISRFCLTLFYFFPKGTIKYTYKKSRKL